MRLVMTQFSAPNSMSACTTAKLKRPDIRTSALSRPKICDSLAQLLRDFCMLTITSYQSSSVTVRRRIFVSIYLVNKTSNKYTHAPHFRLIQADLLIVIRQFKNLFDGSTFGLKYDGGGEPNSVEVMEEEFSDAEGLSTNLRPKYKSGMKVLDQLEIFLTPLKRELLSIG